MKTEISDASLAFSVSEEHRESILRVIEFEKNPSNENANFVCEVMDDLHCLLRDLKNKEQINKRLDELIKNAIRNTADNNNTKQYFDVKKSLHLGKITNNLEMLTRLMTIFDNPLDFSSCIEFNFNNLKELMGDDFIEKNHDIIMEYDYAPAVYIKY